MDADEVLSEDLEDERIDKEFVAEQLFNMAATLDYSDSAGEYVLPVVLFKFL